jgi:WD40 repeat protein
MMMEGGMRTAMVLLVMILLLPVGSGATVRGLDGGAGEGESDAPYIYYYSDVLNAFVVERADGTDTHLIAQELMNERTADIRLTDWSPNGEWLVWQNSGQPGETGERLNRTWGLNVHTGQRLSSLETIPSVRYVEWSPDGSYLLAASSTSLPFWHRQQQYEYQEYIFTVIDVATDTVTAKFRGRKWYEIFNSLQTAQWLPGGEQVAFHHYFMHPAAGQLMAKVVDVRTGNIQRLVEPATAHSVFNAYSSDANAWYGYHLTERRELVLVNLLTGERRTLPADTEKVGAIHWYPDGERALVYMGEGDCRAYDSCAGDVWYLSLTEDVFEEALAEGLAVRAVTWQGQFSPDGQRTLLAGQDGQVYVVEPPDRVSMFVHEGPLPLNALHWEWQTPDEVLVCNWQDAGGTLVDVATGDFQAVGHAGPLPPNAISVSCAESSSSGRYIVIPTSPFTVIDRHNQTEVTLPPHPELETLHEPADLAFWHPREPWLIMAAASTLTAGGSSGPRLMSVARADGQFYRHFDAPCWANVNCPRWLPASVEVERLP